MQRRSVARELDLLIRRADHVVGRNLDGRIAIASPVVVRGEYALIEMHVHLRNSLRANEGHG